jgi:toxin FitB
MWLLDTNVLSELRRAGLSAADPNVVSWVAAIDPATAFVSVVSMMELEYGILKLTRSDPAQAQSIRRWKTEQIERVFADRILEIDLSIAHRCAALHVPDRKPERDALIAATALVRGLTVVTRNVRDFAAVGLAVINPWDTAPYSGSTPL